VEGFLLAQSEIPTDKIKAYRDTQYCVAWDGDPFTLMIDTRSEALSRLYTTTGQACGVFIHCLYGIGEFELVSLQTLRERGEIRRYPAGAAQGEWLRPSRNW
jgi:hypothetical protein